ncbi:hypothetical protein L218DRAFT_960681 [Marasmius fiardii PR-910]|nr:hypothetical protein L218DRAFT_960681 [Marasmius fiardii PR-910]
MLSSLSSFLPSALHHLNPQSESQNNNAPEIDVEDEEEDVKAVEEDTSDGKKGKKEKSPHETFIFVRPPPAKSNHPLNLQVQLVPPNSRQRRQSIDSRIDASDAESEGVGGGGGGTQLNRTPSMNSEVSGYSTTASGYGSTSSFASYSSTASGAGGRRMIIPLYNLQAHNVMTNTIVDAGTDAKIARFQKRGLEMIDLAMLEPVEVWVTPTGAVTTAVMSRAAGGTRSARGSLDVDPPLRNRVSSLGRPRTSPGSSALSLSSAGDHHQVVVSPPAIAAGSPPKSPLPLPSSPNPAAKKTNIFGKLFDRKKKEPSIPDSTPDVQVISPSTPTFTPGSPQHSQSPSSSSRHSRGLSGSFFKRSSGIPATPTTPTDPDVTPNPNQKSNGFLRPSTPSGIKNLTNLMPTSANPRHSISSGVPPPSPPLEKTDSRSSSRSRTRDQTHLFDVDHTPKVEQTTSTSSRFSTMSQQSAVSTQAQAVPIPTLPPTLGIIPTLSTPGGPSVLASGLFSSFSSRGYPPPKGLGFGKGPAMYVWVVRRWFKGTERGLLDKGLVGLGIKGIEGHGHDQGSEAVDLSQIEVRVEWKRGGRKKREKLKERRRKEKEMQRLEGDKSVSATGSRRSSCVASSIATGEGGGGGPGTVPSSSNPSFHVDDRVKDKEDVAATSERKKKHRLSTVSIGSLGASSDGGGGGGSIFRRGSRKRTGTVAIESDQGTDGEDSDPEDSETPWGCTVKVRRLGSGTSGSGWASKAEPLKVKVGTLSPTPHHPKVVAMLKVPFPLPDVEVERMNLRKREIGKVVPPIDENDHKGLVLTAEEIKDVICSTGLWIVVREGFGGVGKVSRKGDGWSIRA